MANKLAKIRFEDVAIVMDPALDQVAVAKRALRAGEIIAFKDSTVKTARPVAKGHRFAVRDIHKGEFVRQYGYAFGCSRGIRAGETITAKNMESRVPKASLTSFKAPRPTDYDPGLISRTFLGYRRQDGKAGTRNYYLIVPTSMCASETCRQIAEEMSARVGRLKKFPAVDGIVAVPHTEGCGCDTTVSIDRLLRVLKGYISHPNVGGCLIVDLGCEQTNYAMVSRHMNGNRALDRRPIDWLTIEASGGVESTKAKARAIIEKRLPAVSRLKRTPCPLGSLVLGTECGASDSFSGITANPLIGNVADKIIRAKGSAIMSEIPEMVGTLAMLQARFRSKQVAKKFMAAIAWYEDLASRMGVDLSDNLVPKNIEGGLANSYIKSLGAVFKGGTTAIEDVVDYGVALKKPGLSIMQGPGGDLESVTGLVASGANVVCFSTGQGTPTGNAICPVIKISSNNEVFAKLSQDMDFNAGRLLSERKSINGLGDELLELIIAVASGKKTAAERSGQRQFQIWTAGKLSL